ncbi:MAG: hypothetical protein QXU44_09910, partial [Candidatus Caldarchaeum sp.]
CCRGGHRRDYSCICFRGDPKRFYNNINSKTVKNIEEIATAIALTHNLLKTKIEGGVIPR